MNYHITHTTKYMYSEAVPVCHNLVHLAPRTLPNQVPDKFRLLIHPEPYSVSYGKDYFGNDVSYFSIYQTHRGLTVTATSDVAVSAAPEVVPDDTAPWEQVAAQLKTDRAVEVLDAYQYVFDSSSIQRFPELAEYVKPSFPAGRPILAGVIDLTARIYNDFTYDPRATTVHTPIREVFEQRHGVCQDFAHLQIGCLRSIGLAARYVSGYLRTEPPPGKPRLVGSDASHAWLAVYCGEAGWVGIDPTNNVLASTDHITIGWGREYNDVCPIQGIIIGGGEHRMSVEVDVVPPEVTS
ncbi:transglutaminase family protein [Symmachiella dynata]|uniref:transglutaminase family protein n=1 Tax=Symmachiella dynata TaxID=2527995 RepID=UPI0030EEBCB2